MDGNAGAPTPAPPRSPTFPKQDGTRAEAILPDFVWRTYPLMWRARPGSFLWRSAICAPKAPRLKPYCSQPPRDVAEGLGGHHTVGPLSHLQRGGAEVGRVLVGSHFCFRFSEEQEWSVIRPKKDFRHLQSKLLTH